MPKLVSSCHVTKTVVGDYGFKLFQKAKTVVGDYSLRFKVKTVVGDYSFKKNLNHSNQPRF